MIVFAEFLVVIDKGNFEIDQVFRVAVKVDGREVEPVLNDVAVFHWEGRNTVEI
jgi:hypothetical protein